MSRIATILVSIFALQSAAQPPSIAGARISLVPRPQAILNVTIENRRASPLVEWQMDVSLRGTAPPRMTQSGYQSIQPGEKRTVPIGLPNPEDVATATLVFVAFADGFYEGTSQAVQVWQKARGERAKDLSYWTRVFGLMPRVSEPDLRRYLSDHISERTGQVPNDVSGVRAKVQSVLYRYPSGPDVWELLDRLRAETQAALTAATRQPPDGSRGGVVDAVSSVVISSQEQGRTTAYDAAIENLRGVPIEALGFEILEQGTGRARSGRRMDFCAIDAASHPNRGGRIQPREIREERTGIDVNPDQPLPVIRLTFILFDDLSFEGAPHYRDELFEDRERQADDYAAGIAALAAVATLPPSHVEAFLAAKRAERARQLQSAGVRGDVSVLDNLIRNAKTSPEQLVASAKDRGAMLERVRQRLLRHKSPAAK